MEASRAVARRADDLGAPLPRWTTRHSVSGRGRARFHALLPVDAVYLATADPTTLLVTSMFAEEPLVGAADRFLDNELGQNDVNKFQALATGPRHVAALDSVTGE